VTITSLTKTKAIRIYDVSAGGCLIETREPIPVGTVGLLTMDFEGRPRQEWIRVCRVQADESRRGPCLVSVEFLPLKPAGLESLRGAMLRGRAGRPHLQVHALSGRSSGDPGKSAQPHHVDQGASSLRLPADHEDLNSSCSALDLAVPLLNGSARACPKPEKE
jgi:hypothetical protein